MAKKKDLPEGWDERAEGKYAHAIDEMVFCALATSTVAELVTQLTISLAALANLSSDPDGAAAEMVKVITEKCKKIDPIHFHNTNTTEH